MADVSIVIRTLTEQLQAGAITIEQYQQLILSITQSSPGAAAAAAPAPALASPPSVRTEVIACPNCGGKPVPDPPVGSSTYRCRYCQATFTRENVSQQIAQLRDEVQKLLSSAGAVSSTAVDASARAFIFREKIYPGLQREFSRSLEFWDDFREHPVVQTVADRLFTTASSGANPLDPSHGQLPLFRRMAGLISAPPVQDFAKADEDQRRLAQMQKKVEELIYAANLYETTGRLTVEGYAAAGENLAALQKIYTEAVRVAASEPEREFLRACLERWEGAGKLMQCLREIHERNGVLHGLPLRGAVGEAEMAYGRAIQRAGASNHSPMETVMWTQGAERELSRIQVLGALLDAFERMGLSQRGQGFFSYIDSVDQFVENSGAPAADTGAILMAITQAALVFQARRGSVGLARLNDWSWQQAAADMGRKRGMFGGGEEITGMDAYWQPFWLGQLQYSVSQGTVFRSGAEQQGYILLDASTAQRGFGTIVTPNEPLFQGVRYAKEQSVIDTKLTLPAILSPQAAQQRMEAFVRERPDIRNPRIALAAIIYLPMCLVTYNSKEGVRRDVLGVCPSYNKNIQSLANATVQLLTAFSV